MRQVNAPVTKFYRNTALLLLVLAVILGLGLFYFTLGEAKVIVTPALEKVNTEFIVDIRQLPFTPPDEAEVLSGKIFEVFKEDSQTFPATGSKIIKGDTVGQVTIINNYSKDQPLVATTQLLSKEGVLLRTKNYVEVPAGGRIKVSVYPDDPENFTSLSPTTFTIVRLWQGLQDKIYAQSDETLTNQGFEIKIVEQKDIDGAKAQLVDDLFRQSLTEIDKQLTPEEKLMTKIVSREILESSSDAEVGQEKEEISYSVKIKVVTVVFDENKLLAMVAKRLAANLSGGKKLAAIDTDSLTYDLEKYDMTDLVANIKVSAQGQVVLENTSEILNKKNLVGLTEQEVKDYFSQFSEIKEVKIEFSPSWLTKMPNSEERIELEIK